MPDQHEELVGGRYSEVEEAALVGLAGLDPLAFLEMPEGVERLTVQGLAQRILELREMERQDLAVRIANAVGAVFGGS